jgi:two-component system, NarL family, sensor histidine kinase UhpB
MSDAASVQNAIDRPLFWRVCLINGTVFTVATVTLAVSPATVSYRIQASQAVVLASGLAVMLVLNGLLLHTRLAPLDRLCRLMGSVDLLRPGQRVQEAGNGAVAQVVRNFNEMLARLEAERAASAAQALAATEAERQRIARELHDEIGQRLTVVLLGLKRVADRAPAELAEELRLIQAAARSSLEDMRLIARRLRPGVLQDLGLQAALAALGSEFSGLSPRFWTRGVGYAAVGSVAVVRVCS